MKELFNIDRQECPRCGSDRLRSWSELTDEEQEVVKRLPASAEYPPYERQTTHRWCRRCWFEENTDTAQV
jgi:hypothetical protein